MKLVTAPDHACEIFYFWLFTWRHLRASKPYEKETNIARTTPNCNSYPKLDFEAAFCGRQVYRANWTIKINLKLKCTINIRDEAVDHDENAIDVYL